MDIKESLFPFIAAYEINKEIFQRHEFFESDKLNSKWKNLLEIKLGMYEAIIQGIEKKITGTDFETINNQWVKELNDSNVSKKNIDDILAQIHRSTYEGVLIKWKKLIGGIVEDGSNIEKISNDLYTYHERGIANVERKATSILAAVGFSISLISIVGGLSNAHAPWYFVLLSLLFFGIAIINMVIAGISAWYAERVHKRSMSTVIDLEKTIQSQNFKSNWAAIQLTNLELNNDLWAIKANWLDVAQSHFIRGLIATVVGFFVLVAEILIDLH